MKSQLWYCEVCLEQGSVPYKPNADIFSVAYAIERANGHVSRGCPVPMEKIRAPINKKALQELIQSRSLN